MKKLKKSSIAIILGMSLLASSVSVYAAYPLYGTITYGDNILGTAKRVAVDNLLPYAYFKINSNTCETGYTLYKVIRTDTLAMVCSSGVSIENDDYTKHTIYYNSAHQEYYGFIQLVGVMNSSYSGYTVSGEWNPNG